MRSRWLLFAAVTGCAHAPGRQVWTDSPVVETAVGAYLENPRPYLLALDSCAFSGSVSKDLRVTTIGAIVARCEHGISLHWNAVSATSIRIDGPATIRTPSAHLDYLYDVALMSGTTRLQGRMEVEWATAPGCENLVELRPFNLATFVLPKRAGSCTLSARSASGLRAELTIVIE